MDHPEFLAVPILMLLDYSLTVFGAKEREKKHGEFFKLRHYELNPIFQRDIARKKWFSPRHLAITAVVAAALMLGAEYGNLPAAPLEGVLGYLVVFFGAIVGRHVGNILSFRRLVRKSDDIEGEVTLSHPLAASMSMHQCFDVVLPMALVALFSPSAFVIGGFVGALGILFVHSRWLRAARRKEAAARAAVS